MPQAVRLYNTTSSTSYIRKITKQAVTASFQHSSQSFGELAVNSSFDHLARQSSYRSVKTAKLFILLAAGISGCSHYCYECLRV